MEKTFHVVSHIKKYYDITNIMVTFGAFFKNTKVNY